MSSQKSAQSTRSKWLPISILIIAVVAVMVPAIYRSYSDRRQQPQEVITTLTTAHEGLTGWEQLEGVSSLNVEQKNWVAQKANQEQCACKCGHSLASCVKGDPTCPERPKNLVKIQEFIREASRKFRT